ncbi:MAG: hypothetical protein RLZZ69_1501 [Cyanobacteriota bacterium]|jgi:hypothetical protein
MHIKNRLELIKQLLSDYSCGNISNQELRDRVMPEVDLCIDFFDQSEIAWHQEQYEVYSLTVKQVSFFADSIKTNARSFRLPIIARLVEPKEINLNQISIEGLSALPAIEGVNEVDYIVESYQEFDLLIDAVANLYSKKNHD